MAGGVDDHPARGELLHRCDAYDALTSTWAGLPPLPRFRHGCCGAAIADKVYAAPRMHRIRTGACSPLRVLLLSCAGGCAHSCRTALHCSAGGPQHVWLFTDGLFSSEALRLRFVVGGEYTWGEDVVSVTDVFDCKSRTWSELPGAHAVPSYLRHFGACAAATVHALRSVHGTIRHATTGSRARAAAGPRLRRTFAAIGAVELGPEHKLALVLAGACQPY